MGLMTTLKTTALSFFPGSGGRRDAARHDMSEFSGWAPRARFAGASRDYGADVILGRSRDLDENNGWINAGLDRRVESVIGVNIKLAAKPKYLLLNRDYKWRTTWTRDVQARFDVWGNDIERRCDARQRLSFGAMARLAYLGYVRDGEVCAEVRDDKRGLANTTNVLLIEPERVGTPPLLKGSEGPLLRDGIAYDKNGAMTGAWVRSGHPDDVSVGMERERFSFVPARSKTGRAKFLHVFNPRRAEQSRGISRLAEIMVPAKMVDRVDRAEVNAALKSAIFSFFIQSAGSPEDIAEMLAPAGADGELNANLEAYLDYRNEHPVRVEGAQVNQLFPGETVHTPDRTSPNSNYPTFVRFVLQKIAGSLGVSYPQLSQDYAGINYSSARALLNEIWRSFMEDRIYFTQAFLTPIYAAWLEMEVANGDVKVPGGPTNFYRNKTALCMAEWIGPGRGMTDPLKEESAYNLGVASGRKSTVAIILEDGRDPEDVLAEERHYQDRREELGLPPVNHNLKAVSSGGEDGTAPSPDGDREEEAPPTRDADRQQQRQDA